jgi:hypothetical protein
VLSTSEPRTDDIEYGSWRTPQHGNADQGPKSAANFAKKLPDSCYITLTDQVEHWQTPSSWPTVRLGGSNRNSRQAITNAKKHPSGKSDLGLEQATEVAGGVLPKELMSAEELPQQWRTLWQTPSSTLASAGCRSRSGPLRKKMDRQTRNETPGSYRGDLADHVGQQDPASPSTNGKPRGSLNPAWVAQLQGVPDGWLDLPAEVLSKLSETRTRRNAPKS